MRGKGWIKSVRLPRSAGHIVARTACGLLLLGAAGLKIGYQTYHLAADPVSGNRLLDSHPLVTAVACFELFLGLWLVSGVAAKWSWRGALGLFAAFAGVSLVKAVSGASSCGCFGPIAVSPRNVLGLDLAAVTALVCFRPAAVARQSLLQSGDLRRRVAALVCLALASGAAIAWGVTTLDHRLTVEDGIVRRNGWMILEPERWIGRRFPLLKYINIGDKLRAGNWALLLYRDGCPHCREAIVQCKDGTFQGNGHARLALVEVPPSAGSRQEFASMARDRGWLRGHLDESVKWFVRTPVMITSRQGVVVAVTYPEDSQGT